MANRMNRPWLLWAPLVATACIGGLAIYGLAVPKDEQVRSAMVGQKLPEFSLPPATQVVLPLSNKDMGDGKPRLLNIFASWCIPCKAEAPQLEELKAAGVEIDGIAIRDPYRRIGSDSEMAVQLKLGSSGVPETYVIGADGTIMFQHIGDIRVEHVPMLIEKLKVTK
jgi:cytochrome c biogenesis protein CcmG, thiol:disulfide interchange protein DsbE